MELRVYIFTAKKKCLHDNKSANKIPKCFLLGLKKMNLGITAAESQKKTNYDDYLRNAFQGSLSLSDIKCGFNVL